LNAIYGRERGSERRRECIGRRDRDVYARKRERKKERERERERKRERECVCVCVCVRGIKREKERASGFWQ
jgi:hypothetical protein